MRGRVVIGTHGRALGPMRPAGKIRIGDETFEARSEGGWIDAGAEVVIVGNSAFGLLVRIADGMGEHPVEVGPSPVKLLGHEAETTPIEAPPAFVERINGVVYGVIATGVLVATGLLVGRPLSLGVLFAPVAGIAAGEIFQWCVRGASDFVGPRADHRLLANVIALLATAGGTIGIVFGLVSGFGFLGLSAGLVLGTLLGGLISWGGMVLFG